MRHWVLILAVALFGLAGCKEGLTSHNITLSGVDHGKKLYQGPKDCTACHGVGLNGNAYIPGCYNCHGTMWNLDEHRVSRGGVMHMDGVIKAKDNCGSCHGTDLKGKGSGERFQRPSCYQCHDDNWTGLDTHVLNKNGVIHAKGLWNPTANCTNCHGSNLKGNASANSGAVSCYKCHGAKWEIADHTISKNGKLHKSGLYSPSTNCVECHGSDLKGDSGPSCYKCHGSVWSWVAHNDSQDGVGHASDKDDPYNDCVGCHGSDLKGDGTAPSCYLCHGAEWDGGGDDNSNDNGDNGDSGDGGNDKPAPLVEQSKVRQYLALTREPRL